MYYLTHVLRINFLLLFSFFCVTFNSAMQEENPNRKERLSKLINNVNTFNNAIQGGKTEKILLQAIEVLDKENLQSLCKKYNIPYENKAESELKQALKDYALEQLKDPVDSYIVITNNTTTNKRLLFVALCGGLFLYFLYRYGRAWCKKNKIEKGQKSIKDSKIHV